MNGGTNLNDVCSGTSSPKLCSSPLIHCKLHWGFVNVAKLWSSIAQLCLTNNCSLLSSDKFLLLQVWEFNVHRASYLSLAPPKSTVIELPAWCDDSYSYQDGDKPGISVRNISWQCATLTTWFGFKHQMEESEDRMYFSEKCMGDEQCHKITQNTSRCAVLGCWAGYKMKGTGLIARSKTTDLPIAHFVAAYSSLHCSPRWREKRSCSWILLILAHWLVLCRCRRPYHERIKHNLDRRNNGLTPAPLTPLSLPPVVMSSRGMAVSQVSLPFKVTHVEPPTRSCGRRKPPGCLLTSEI